MFKRLVTLAFAGALSLCLGIAAIIHPGFAAQGTGCMPTTGTVSSLTFAQAVNAGIAALISSNSGASAPATDCSAAAVKGQVWLDTSTTPNVLKQYDGASWISLGAVDAANHLWAPPIGGGSATVTAAATTDICTSPSAMQTITGTTTITSFGSSCVVGQRKTLIFSDATPLTYDGTALILPGQRDYTTTAGDVADAIYLGSGNWRVVNITKIDGSSVVNPALPLGTSIFGIYADPPAKTVLGFGQALSRASYPDYFAAVTRSQSGTLTAGNNTITLVANTAGLGAGMPVEGAGVQAGTVILSVTSSTIVMSKTATANGAQSISVIIPGYGDGGDSTTVGVIDFRGRVLAGRDDMGGVLAGRLTPPASGGVSNSTVLASAGGTHSHTLTASQMPSHTHTGTTGGNSVDHTHTYSAAYSIQFIDAQNGALPVATAYSTFTTSGISANHTHNFTTNSAGSGSAHNIVQPTSITECAVVVLP